MAESDRPDDKSILDADRLFRRVAPNQVEKNPDGSPRPSSAVFKTDEMSVNIESVMQKHQRPPEATLEGRPGDSLCSITPADVRAQGNYPIVRDPEPENPAHGLVLGKKKSSFANAMVRAHKWVVPPQ